MTAGTGGTTAAEVAVMAQQLVIAVKALQFLRDNVSAETDWRDVESWAGDAIDAVFVLGAMPGDDEGPYYVELDTTPPHPPLTSDAYKEHLDHVFAPVNAEVDRLRAEQQRQAEQHARDMAAEDGDYDRCEPTL